MPRQGWANAPKPTHRELAGAVLIAMAILFADVAAAKAADNRRLVVVLYPEDTDGSPGTVAADRGIRSTFETSSPDYVEVRNEYVDVSRSRDPQVKRIQREYLRRKYVGRKVDLVITVLSSALDYALEHRDEIFPGVPVVAAAVDQREMQSRKFPPDVIGVPMRVDMAATLEIALKLHPNTRRVFVVAGHSPFDLAWVAEARRTFKAYENRLEFEYITDLPIEDLLARIAELPERSIVYYLHLFQDGTGKTFVPADALDILSRKSNVPVYGHSEPYVGRGIVGGCVISLGNEGKQAGRLGLRILAGEKPSTIPLPEVSENTNLFDWRQLQRWGISENRLPPECVVQYKEPGLWDKYKWEMSAGIALCVVQALLIAGLLVQLVKRRRAEARFRQVLETAPTGMVLFGMDGTIVLVNTRMEQLFGYTKAELLSQLVELIIPKQVDDQNSIRCDELFASSQIHAVGLRHERCGRRKDGSEFPIEIDLSLLRAAQGWLVHASIIDLTERRRTEDRLRASQRELQLLTGRLLEAQEAERRRIARELHDDLNQSLALLCVEMELLVVAPPGSSVQTADRLRELSFRVKELSSTVHDLSHQLHPSKLEQLGLAVSIRGLCKELAHGHGLDAKFTHGEITDRIPAATALCLYRIVQEALRNVVKHSGTTHATVELRMSQDEVRLCITDEGAGFDPLSLNGGLGLVSMRERLNLVGGEIVIDARLSAGTRINVRVPLPALAPETPLDSLEECPQLLENLL